MMETWISNVCQILAHVSRNWPTCTVIIQVKVKMVKMDNKVPSRVASPGAETLNQSLTRGNLIPLIPVFCPFFFLYQRNL